MNTKLKAFWVLPALLLLAACASVPDGPSTMALPGTGMDFDRFRHDDASCRQFAHDQVGRTSANQAANQSFAESAIVGTVLGAAIGAAAGGGRGAGVGATTGLFVGSLIGLDEAHSSSYGIQRRYDHAYIQCMYAEGHRVPVSGRVERYPAYSQSPPRPAGYPPPPPPGYRPPLPYDAP